MSAHRPRSSRPPQRTGFTLIEVLAVMAGLALLISFGCALIAGLFRMHKSSAASRLNLVRHEVFADQFRDDVAHADSAPAKLDQFQAGPHCLILAMHDSSPVVYFEEAGIWKRRYGSRKDVLNLHPGPEGTQLEFLRSGPADRLVTVRILPPAVPRLKDRAPLEISAALGGDVR
jgi:prepilin-type N-terminal cleavage/methylation domain-containing protein